MRIVGGRHRGRRLAAPADARIRPTADRARETLFNILAHGRLGAALAGARVLDAFCGTGALGLEALSRGAAAATFLDRDAAALALVRANLAALGETGTVLRVDAAHPGRAPAAHDLALLDPPYRSGLGPPALAALAEAGWLAPGALAVLEVAADEALAPPAGFAALEARRSGRTRLAFLRWDGGGGG